MICILGVIGIIMWGCTSPILSSDADKFEEKYFDKGWSQQIGDESIPLDDIQDYISVGEGEERIFTCTLPEMEDGMVFLFYSNNEEVTCYVDDVLVQNFSIQEGFELLKTPGSTWNQVDFDSSMSGKTCTLIFNSLVDDYEYQCDIYYVENQYVDTVRFANIGGNILSAFGIFCIMLVISFTGIIERRSHRKRFLLAIAQYFLIVLLWLFAELNVYDLFWGRPIISYLLGEIFKRMVPISLLYLAKNSTNQYWHPRIIKGITILAWLNLFVPFIIQFTMGISLLEMKSLNCFISAIIDIALLIITGEKILHFKKLKYEEYPCLVVPILIISGGADNAILYLNREYSSSLGMRTAVGGIAFSCVTLMVLTYVNARIEQDKIEIEKTCRDLENTTLTEQLEAHFIYNTLNTITSYCRTEPDEADKAIRTFAAYMRSYLHLIHQRVNIPIEQELDLVADYLSIQKMRLGNQLSFSFDTEFLDFKVPPFAVYTIVENAVIHGIRKKEGGGTIIISTKLDGDSVQLIIADTGVGYDISVPKKESSVGVENTKRRLEIMRNGSFIIDSTIGVGTIVMMIMPVGTGEFN